MRDLIKRHILEKIGNIIETIIKKTCSIKLCSFQFNYININQFIQFLYRNNQNIINKEQYIIQTLNKIIDNKTQLILKLTNIEQNKFLSTMFKKALKRNLNNQILTHDKIKLLQKTMCNYLQLKVYYKLIIQKFIILNI